MFVMVNTNALVSKLANGNQLQTLELESDNKSSPGSDLSKVCRVTKHVNVEHFGHLASTVVGILCAEVVTDLKRSELESEDITNVCAFLLHNFTLFSGRLGRANSLDEITDLGGRHLHS